MKQLFLAIFNVLNNSGNGWFVAMWNNQLRFTEEGVLEQITMPAVLIEFESNTTASDTLGGGDQIFDPLIIKVHILHRQEDAGDGTFEQNLDVYDLKDQVYKILGQFFPNKVGVPAGMLQRIGEEQDYDHKNVYHYIQTYHTTLTDSILEQPVDGIDSINAPLPAEIDLTVQGSQDVTAPHKYYFGPAADLQDEQNNNLQDENSQDLENG